MNQRKTASRARKAAASVTDRSVGASSTQDSEQTLSRGTDGQAMPPLSVDTPAEDLHGELPASGVTTTEDNSGDAPWEDTPTTLRQSQDTLPETDALASGSDIEATVETTKEPGSEDDLPLPDSAPFPATPDPEAPERPAPVEESDTVALDQQIGDAPQGDQSTRPDSEAQQTDATDSNEGFVELLLTRSLDLTEEDPDFKWGAVDPDDPDMSLAISHRTASDEDLAAAFDDQDEDAPQSDQDTHIEGRGNSDDPDTMDETDPDESTPQNPGPGGEGEQIPDAAADKPVSKTRVIPVYIAAAHDIDEVIEAILKIEHDLCSVDLDLIDFHPKNRKYFKPGTLEELAASIVKIGLIHEIILRPMPNGRFELVAGERRVRASRIGGLKEIRAKIYVLSDSEARQIRISENTHREDTHPMEEAATIGEMLDDFSAVDVIARRLGKPMDYIQNRLKLLSLVPEAQELFLADLIGVREAQQLAAFEDDLQETFLDQNYKGWKTAKQKPNVDFKYEIDRLKRSLKNPPFDPEDPTLNPKRGRCSTCPFNSGCQQYLFAEVATDPVCKDATCFQIKTNHQLVKTMTAAVARHKPMAIVMENDLSNQEKALIKQIQGTDGVAFYLERLVHEVKKPQKPTEGASGRGPKLDKKAFAEKMADYNEAVAYQETAIKNRKIFRAVLIERGGKVSPYMFTLDSKAGSTGQSGKVGLVREDIKAGVATTEQVTAELNRIRENEATALKKASTEVTEKIHDALEGKTDAGVQSIVATELDLAFSRWQIYNMLDFMTQRDIQQQVLPQGWAEQPEEDRLMAFARLTDDQAAYLFRKRLLAIPESKQTGSFSAFIVSLIAAKASIDVDKIRQETEKKGEERRKKFKKDESELLKVRSRKEKKRDGKNEPKTRINSQK